MWLLNVFLCVAEDLVIVCVRAHMQLLPVCNHIVHTTTPSIARAHGPHELGSIAFCLLYPIHILTFRLVDVRIKPANWRYNIIQYSRVNVYAGSACLPVSFRYCELHAVAPAKRVLFLVSYFVLVIFTFWSCLRTTTFIFRHTAAATVTLRESEKRIERTTLCARSEREFAMLWCYVCLERLWRVTARRKKLNI